jgi:hypothetical protein
MPLHQFRFACIVLVWWLCWRCSAAEDPSRTPDIWDYRVELQTVLQHDDGQFLWYHPRVAAIPAEGGHVSSLVMMTLQKHLHVSDFYSGLSVMQTCDLGGTWAGPVAPAALDWSRDGDVVVSVADVTPGWHGPTKRLIAVGARVRYGTRGQQLEDQPRAQQTAYAVYDPAADAWSAWQQLRVPDAPQFNFARSACAQWLVDPDGTVLLPFYIGPSATAPHIVTVMRCGFDGRQLTYREHGNELSLNVERGLVEPSLIRCGPRYYLTLRNDVRGYVTASDDGLHFAPICPWQFDDGSELGSYNTQQHWLEHRGALFLVYTRRGAQNDHIMRHRAPLFMAQVDPQRLCVLRATERILIPERGAELGNFGAARISDGESWVTVSEGVWNSEARRRGATGALFVARILWPARP